MIGAIIVDYRSDPHLPDALLALRDAAGNLPVRAVVAENCPVEQRADVPEGLEVHFITSRENLGYARAVNLARRKLETPYLLVLNPDVELVPGSLRTAYAYMEADPGVGILAPKLLDSTGGIQYSARTFYDFRTVLFRRTFLGRLLPDHPVIRRHLMWDWDHAEIREIDWALGACMMIRSEAVGEKIFDERFFLYFEDVDLCVRLKKAGWRIVYHPEVVGVHEHRQESRRKFCSLANYHHFKSWIKFLLKHRSISGIG